MIEIGPKITTFKSLFIAAFIIMLSMAFLQCFKTTHDLNWGSEPDFDRDVSFVRGELEGNYGKDPSYAGAYLWYNPLLFSVETVLVKFTGLPPNVVAVRAGVYLNILGPIVFFLVIYSLFDIAIALAALLSFLFFANGNLMGWASATYSPWLFPVCFNQFIFYINVFLCYKAFSSQKYFWFIVLGATIGICFLGDAAPTLLIIMIMAVLQLQNIFAAFGKKDFLLLKKYFLQGILSSVFFIIAGMPLLYYVVGKYHLHLINRATFEYTENLFYLSKFPTLIKANLSLSLVISLMGFLWFYKNFHNLLVRKIVFSWLAVSIFMYLYSTLVAWVDARYGIHLPGTVPAFHYFYYIKALQSIFYGFGFLFIFQLVLKWLVKIENSNLKNALVNNYGNLFYVMVILVCAFVYFPFYEIRTDFVLYREQSIEKEAQKDKIAVHDFILQHISSNKVILCEKDPSLFPVMTTGRKMVSTAYTFSNPYLDFNKRETDRENMLQYLKNGEPSFALGLFKEYHVDYVLLSKTGLIDNKRSFPFSINTVFENDTYVIFKITN